MIEYENLYGSIEISIINDDKIDISVSQSDEMGCHYLSINKDHAIEFFEKALKLLQDE